MKPFGLLLVLLGSSFCLAQHNNRSARDLQFRFGNPGARSLGFGGAFIALADDATAPVANPAGMVRTARRSVSLELNYHREENEIPFQAGVIRQTNIFEFDFDFETSSAPESSFQVPFLAVVFPKDNLRYGFFAHQQADLKRNYTTGDIILCDIAANFYPECENDPSPDTFPPSTDVLDLQIRNLGASLAYDFGGRFSAGLSVFFSDLDYRADSTIELPQIAGVAVIERLARGDDQDFGAIAGFLLKLTDELSMGVTYKRQPEFEYTARLVKSIPVPRVPDDFETVALFKIPDALGFGISVNPVDTVTINLDANRIYYSQITDHLLDFTQVALDGETRITQTMADVTEIHLGLEWIFPQMTNPLSVRVGYWLDPYHAAVNTVEDSQILEGPASDPRVRDVFFLHQFEENENHYALGLGWTFGAQFQFDLAVEASENSQTGTLSGIYRF